MTSEAWRAGHALLGGRVATIPEAIRWTATVAHPAPGAATRRIVASGLGSSEAHARFLAHLLAGPLGRDARFEPVSEVATTAGARDGVLVLFSQGVSPNVRLALERRGQWAQVVLVTAVGADGASEAQRFVRSLRDAGVVVVPVAGADEYGALVRVVGPMAGYVAAYRIAAALSDGRLAPFDVDAVLAAVARAPAAAARLAPDDVARGLAFVASGAYASLLTNLRDKVVEGMLLPAPPVWDVLHVAHGPFQEAYPRPATFVALTRPGAPLEDEGFARLERALDPARHRLIRLPATLPGPLAILEHEAMLNTVMLAWIAAHAVDQVDWPGKGREAPLYALGTRRLLASMTWPEVGARTAVIPLGALEQHGPHLPLATDTWIADALGERVCARLDDAVLVPALGLGCSPEHLAFPGTVALTPATLVAVLADTIRSLGRHGVERAFVFSAHGGNVAPLRAALATLRAAVAPVEVIAHLDLDGITARLHALAADAGIPAEAAGHHAGEVETSIMLALRPGSVRIDALAAGLLHAGGDAQAIFYPSLRDRAPAGTVGDPRRADAARGERYLAAWADALVDTYRAYANGTKKA